MRFALVFLLMAITLAAPLGAQASSPTAEALFAALETPSPAGHAHELAELARLGPAAADRALAGFASASDPARRMRAWLIETHASRALLADLLAVQADPLPAVRASFVAFFARADLGVELLDERVGKLAAVALEDGDVGVRERALRGLAELDQPLALERLFTLIDSLAPRERGLAAALAAERPRARELVVRRVVHDFDGTANEDPLVLAALLGGYGRALAEIEGGGATPAQRAPLLLARRDPDPRVARAGILALEAFLRRMLVEGDAPRLASALEALGAEGLEREIVLHARARSSFLIEPDASAARAAALELWQRARGSGRAAAAELGGLASLALERFDEASVQFDDAASLLEAEFAEHVDGASKIERARQAELLHRRARIELARAYLALARARDAGEASALEFARSAHTLALESALAAVEADRSPERTLDALLEDELGPLLLFGDNPRSTHWPVAKSLALFQRMGRVLASVASDEFPGFEPLDTIASGETATSADPKRRALLMKLQDAELTAVAHEASVKLEKALPRAARDPLGLPGDEELLLLELEARQADLYGERERVRGGDLAPLLQLRAPSGLGLRLARALRDEGRPREARELAERLRADVERTGVSTRYLWGIEIEADLETLRGSCLMDEGDSERAEVELTRAEERLEALEKELGERNVGPLVLARLRALRAGVLVSLAVNANVKAHDSEKALAYFERAWALRQDEFLRVLRGCYRARAGRKEEARAILRGIVPAPSNFYNLACTWALLGEKELALSMLAREFEENPLSPGARERQRAWARTDPDLQSLRADPRFRTIVGS